MYFAIIKKYIFVANTKSFSQISFFPMVDDLVVMVGTAFTKFIFTYIRMNEHACLCMKKRDLGDDVVYFLLLGLRF